MAVPCCSKCSKTHFLKSANHQLGVVLIYCASCGAVAGTIAIRRAGGKQQTGVAKTSTDDWESAI
jgi:hypothetical protein